MLANGGQTPSALAPFNGCWRHPPTDRTDSSGLYFTSKKNDITQHEVLLSAGKGICIQASMKQFRAPEDSWAPLPIYSQQHVGSSKAASLLLETLPMQNAYWSWSTFCSRHYYECPSLNSLIILSNNFFEAREGVRLLMALKHFLTGA